MAFAKGHSTWNKGKKGLQIGWSKGKKLPKLSEEHRKKISKSLMGRISGMLGKHHSEEWKKIMSEKMKGRKYPCHRVGYRHSEETKRKIGLANSIALLGKKQSRETKEKRANRLKGENNPRWIKDRTQLKRYNDDAKDRRSPACRYWHRQVWERDRFRCRINNKDCSGKINAHHILGWSKFPELRYNVNNGITLCQFHHPRKRVDEQKLIPFFSGMVEVK